MRIAGAFSASLLASLLACFVWWIYTADEFCGCEDGQKWAGDGLLLFPVYSQESPKKEEEKKKKKGKTPRFDRVREKGGG